MTPIDIVFICLTILPLAQGAGARRAEGWGTLAPCMKGFPWRRKAAAERRAQKLRADGRAIAQLLKAVASLYHHGGQPPRLCQALVAALAGGARAPAPGVHPPAGGGGDADAPACRRAGNAGGAGLLPNVATSQGALRPDALGGAELGPASSQLPTCPPAPPADVLTYTPAVNFEPMRTAASGSGSSQNAHLPNCPTC